MVDPSAPRHEHVDARNGNFDVLRVAAIAIVIYANGLLLTAAPLVPSYWGAPMARIGIDVLFAISGYLAIESWVRRPHPGVFLGRRAARLFPGLIACVLVTVFVIGAAATTLSLRWYFINRLTVRYLGNAVLIPGLWLPDVFRGQQWSGTVNPMLWTLLAGVTGWLAIAGMGRLSAPRRLSVLLVGALACMGIALIVRGIALPFPMRGLVLDVSTEMPFFLVAAALRLAADVWGTAIWRADVAMLLFAANWIVATWLGPYDLLLEWASLPYMAACFGRLSAPGLGQFGRLGNPSYGFYLYAFPVQQLIVARWPTASYPILACGLVSLAAGYLSWYLVERPVLRWTARGALLGSRMGVLTTRIDARTRPG